MAEQEDRRDEQVPSDQGEPEDRDPVATDEADAAAQEAGEIGGPGSNEELPEEDRPLAESGGGYSEGFEEAEKELADTAAHGDPAPDPIREAGEAEQERAEPEYGEPDRVESTERSEQGQEGRELDR